MTSRPVLQTIESALLSVAQLVDSVVRMIEHLLAAVVSTCLSPSLYAHFYVTPPKSAQAAVDQDGLTRVCTEEGVCYVPATRVHQRRAWRKRKQDDQLKRRKMRAEWAAQGLDVDQMARLEREKKRKSNSGKKETVEEEQSEKAGLSRTTTFDQDEERQAPPLYVMGNMPPRKSKPQKKNEIARQDRTWAQPHEARHLTSVREASHDHGPLAIIERVDVSAVDPKAFQAGRSDQRQPQQAPRRHERLQSAPIPGLMPLKSAASVEAVSASHIGAKFDASKDYAALKSHRHTSSVPSAVLAPVASPSGGPALAQPKPRRPLRTSFDSFPLGNQPAFMATSAPAGLRVSATPPPAFLTRGRNSVDLSNPNSRTGTPAGGGICSDDTNSIRSRMSAQGGRSTPGTPPPYVVQLADKACKSRWESSAKERKGWKGEVKRIAVNKVSERHSTQGTSQPANGTASLAVRQISRT